MKLSMRPYRNEDDYVRIREFLRDLFWINNGRELSWQVYRLDYWRWHGIRNLGHGQLQQDVFIWELPDGRVAAVLNREAPGNAFLQVHPATRSPELEEEMIVTAEEHLTVTLSDGSQKLQIWANEHDGLRQEVLTGRGYHVVDRPDTKEHQRRRPLSVPIADVPIAEGYMIRSLGDAGELPARSWASWRAFHPDEPDERYEGWEWYQNLQQAPLYLRDLDMVAVAPNGDIGSFCTIWYDKIARSGAFEPVGTAPEHQKRGLGKATMTEGLRRLRELGAVTAFVGSYSPAAHALYAAVGFTEYDVSEPWTRE